MPFVNSAGVFSSFVAKKRKCRSATRLRPSFEPLEERCLLSSPGQVIAPGITLFHLDAPDVRPDQILTGADGNLWFDEIFSNRIGKISPAGDISSYTDPSLADPSFAVGADGEIWFMGPGASQIGRVTTDGVFSYFPLTLPTGLATDLQFIAPGVGGEMWFTTTDGIGTISSTGTITFFQPKTKFPIGYLTAGPDGNMWFTEYSDQVVGKITPAGQVTEYTFDSSQIDPHDSMSRLAVGSNGNLWFTLQEGSQIGEVTPDGTLTLFDLPANSSPWDITAGPDGSLWFTGNTFDGSIGRITTEGVVSQFNLAPGIIADGITTGPDNNLWFTTFENNGSGNASIGRMDPTALGSGTSLAVSAIQGTVFTGSVANVTLPTSQGATASIDWGNGQTSPGTLSPNGSGGYLVSGVDAYATPGNYSITISVMTATGVQLTIPSTVKVAANPNEGFVTGLYQQLLGRSAEASGASNWITQLSSGTSRAQIALEIENSLESRNRLVDQLYLHYLNRHADPGGLNAFSSMLGTGGSLEGVTAAILSSQEFLDDSGGTTNGFLSGLYQDVLLRNIDPATLIALEQQLSAAPSFEARFQIAQAVVSSPEAAQTQVQSDYLAILHRSADAGGLAVWSSLMARGISEAVVKAGLLGSDEYFALTVS